MRYCASGEGRASRNQPVIEVGWVIAVPTTAAQAAELHDLTQLGGRVDAAFADHRHIGEFLHHGAEQFEVGAIGFRAFPV